MTAIGTRVVAKLQAATNELLARKNRFTSWQQVALNIWLVDPKRLAQEPRVPHEGKIPELGTRSPQR